jgi:hypothetical protein
MDESINLWEAVAFIIGIVAIVFAAIYLRNRLSQKAQLILRVVVAVGLVTMFSLPLFERFSYGRLIVLSAYVVLAIFLIYRDFKKYKRGETLD